MFQLPDLTYLFENYLGPMSPRSKSLFMMGTPLPMFIMLGLYLFMALFKRQLAPKTPVNLGKFPILYNAFLVCLSAYMAGGLWLETSKRNFTWVCNPWSPDERVSAGLLHYIHVFYVSKYIEYTDTVMMLLRRKFDQISLLHVWHHLAVVMIVYLAVGWCGDGDTYFTCWFNSFVHVWMYLYYLLSALHFSVPWKKYMTQLQIFQFFCGLSQGIIVLAKPGCATFRWHAQLGCAFLVSLIILFTQFYISTFAAPAKKPTTAAVADKKKTN